MCYYQFKKPFIVSCLLAICIICLVPRAQAQFDYDISPVLQLQEQYDDNIFLDRSKKSDSISTISPGFSLLLSHPRFKLTCNYLHDFVYFKNNPQLDYKGDNLNFGAETRITEYLKFLFTENYIKSNNPQLTDFGAPSVPQTGAPNVPQTSTGFRQEYTQNNLSPQLEYRFGAENLAGLTYRNSRYRQKGQGSDDYTENFYDAMLTYWFNDNNGIKLQYSRDMGNFQVQEDFKTDRIAPRLIYRFSRQTEIFADYSYTGTDFHQKGDANDETNPDYFVNDFAVGLKTSPLATVNVEGKLGYYWEQGHKNNDSQGFIYRLWGEKRFSNGTVFMDYRGGFNENYFGLRDSGFYEFWQVSTGFTYNYENILTFRADGSFANNDYMQAPLEKLQNIAGKKDDIWSGNIVIGYKITSFLGFELEYNYLDQASNRNIDSYIDNRITGRLVINFQKAFQRGSNERKQ